MNKTINKALMPAILIFLPVISYYLMGAVFLRDVNFDLHPILYTLIAIWSPMYFSIPALLMSKQRDSYKSNEGYGLSSIVRGIKLMGFLLKDKESKIQFISSLIGWTGIITLALIKFNA